MHIVTAAIIRKEDKVLIARRDKNQKLAGYWEFPGGKLEENETLQQCLERELREEFNITAKASKVIDESIYHYDNGSIRLIALEAHTKDEDFQLCVHDKIEWVVISELLTYNLLPADIPIALTLQEGEGDV